MPIVELLLVNLARAVSDDETGSNCSRIAMSALSSCTSAQTMLQQKKTYCCGSSKEVEDDSFRSKLMKDVMKYVQVKDKYTALCSLLLKSRAFYQTHPIQSEEDKKLSVVDLPRTEKGKPFIPKTSSATESESNCYPLSISHQFPFCGISRVPDSENIRLGVDIVVFEPLRRDLYKTAEDFLLVFRDSFTSWEWQRIHSSSPNDEEMLMEFYLRWSMKESYTKALGLGLHLEFSAFETRLNRVDDGECLPIWSMVASAKDGIHFCGRVLQQSEEVHWDFYFLPLFYEDEPAGCACVCFGPVDKHDDSTRSFEEQISWITLDDLIQWHSKEQ